MPNLECRQCETRSAGMAKHGTRLDVAVVERGLAPSRERARALILAGRVRVERHRGREGRQPAWIRRRRLISLEPDHPYVGRGGVKLAHALDAFGIDPAGRLALDVGASTGGFTDVLLRRGARARRRARRRPRPARLEAADRPRVTVLRTGERPVARAGPLPADAQLFDIVTIDVSFISLRHVLPAIAPFVRRERPRRRAREAAVRGRTRRGRRRAASCATPPCTARVVEEVAAAADSVGLRRRGTVESPITGAEGNREFFLHLCRA